MLGTPVEFVVSLVLFVILLAGLLLNVRKGPYAPLAVFFAYMIVGFSIRRLVLANTEIERGSFWEIVSPYVSSDMLVTQLDLIFCILTASLAYLLIRVSTKRQLLPKLQILVVRPDRIDVSVAAIIWGLCVAGYLGSLVLVCGGIGAAVDMLQRRAVVFGSEVFFIRLLLVLLSMASALLVFKLARSNMNLFSLRAVIIQAIALITIAILFASGGRGATLSQLLVYAFLWFSGGSKTREFASIACLFLVSAFVVVVGMAVRNAAQKELVVTEAFSESLADSGRIYSHAFPLIDLFSTARYFAHQTGFDYGKQFVFYTTRFIPRSIFPGKPQIIGMQIREYFSGHTQSGAPPTFYGEFYIAFGHVGMFVGGVILAFGWYFLDGVFEKASSDSGYAVLYAVLMNYGIFSSFRAGMEMSLFLTMYALAALVLIKLVNSFLLSSNVAREA